jgi:hypothetical protein
MRRSRARTHRHDGWRRSARPTLTRDRPSDVLESAAAKLRELVAFIERKAAAGDAAQQAVLARGDVIIYERNIAHIEQLMEH